MIPGSTSVCASAWRAVAGASQENGSEYLWSRGYRRRWPDISRWVQWTKNAKFSRWVLRTVQHNMIIGKDFFEFKKWNWSVHWI